MDVIMPKMGESITEGTVIKWHKKIGDFVKKDDILFEISTDKVDTEIPSATEGFIQEIFVKENETVEVGTVVATISDSEIKLENKEVAIKTNQTVLSQSATNDSSIDIVMPKMGESIMEGTVIKWHKKIGDFIKKDEIIFEISTDKVDTEVPSAVEGFLTDIFVKEQETVAVGVVVAKISSNMTKNNSITLTKDIKEVSNIVTTDISVPETVHSNFSRIITNNESKDKRFYSPVVLNIVKTNNISFSELENIKGTGVSGRVTKNDVLTFIEKRNNSLLSDKRNIPTPEIIKNNLQKLEPVESKISNDSIEIIPMDNIRNKIMNHMINSRDTSVHVSAMLEVDLNKIYNFLKENKSNIKAREGVNLTYMAFISYAVVKALKKFPFVNASIQGNNILLKKFINLGIAVALEPNGLIVPNIKNADEKNVMGIAKAIKEVAAKARTKKLVPDDITNGTFTITNYGIFGSLFGTPIINQPESAILGIGSVVKRPVVIEVEGEDIIAIRPILNLTLSHDHRLIDGMLGGKFLKYIKELLENFDTKNL